MKKTLGICISLSLPLFLGIAIAVRGDDKDRGGKGEGGKGGGSRNGDNRGGGAVRGGRGDGGVSRPSIPSFSSPGSQVRRSDRPAVDRQPNLSSGRPSIVNNPRDDNRPNLGDRRNDGDRSNFSNIGRNVRGENPNNITRRSNYYHDTSNSRSNWHNGRWSNHGNRHWSDGPTWWLGLGFGGGYYGSGFGGYYGPGYGGYYGSGYGRNYGYGGYYGALALPWQFGYWNYQNPYYYGDTFAADGTTVINYSQPIMIAGTTADSDGRRRVIDSTAAERAEQLLDAARDAFAQGDYKTALNQSDRAIALVPNDAVMHEFRGQVLFATRQYKQAAATLHAVLSAGPGWDWTTMSSLYPNIDVYTEQLRALERYRNENPKIAEARFLLAYHYTTGGHSAAAASELKSVVQLRPNDELSAQLLRALSHTDNDPPMPRPRPAPSERTARAEPPDSARLVGNWKASRPDGSTFGLKLTKDAKFTWNFTREDKTQEFSGTYTVADNYLVLKQSDEESMIGQITPLADNRFTFKLAGDNPNDPGLTFGR
jgi:tetratricopeptide (TPR) repeat protein